MIRPGRGRYSIVSGRRRQGGDDVKLASARNADFPLVRFSAASILTPELVQQKLIAEYRPARAGQLLTSRITHGQEPSDK